MSNWAKIKTINVHGTGPGVATSGTAETRAASAMGWVVLSRKVTATVTRDLA